MMIHSPVNLFYSYAHKDELLREELEKHLKILHRQGYINEWHDRKIFPGDDWKGQISENLAKADIVLVLVSVDFLASEYCYDIELKAALDNHEKGTCRVIPVILKDCNWQIAPLSDLQCVPKDAKPVISKHWHNQDEAFTQISKQIQRIIEELWDKKITTSNSGHEKATKYSVSALNQLPAVKDYFVGRTSEIQEVRAAFSNASFILIEGAGGIGKTQLIAKFLEQTTEIAKERIVWYDCHSTSQPDDVIKVAGFDELLKGDIRQEREKFSSFKDKIEQYNLLVILDNYHDVQHNSSFVSFLAFISDYLKKGHLIVLSRDNIVSPYFHPKTIHVTGLGAESILHAQKLIKHSYPEVTIDYTTLEKVCQTLRGYPLAIDLAVYLLSFGVAAEEIITTAVRDSDLEGISRRLLNEIFSRPDTLEQEKEFIKQFSAHIGKVSEELIKQIIPQSIFKVGLKKLVAKNILYYKAGTLELHPLVREYCYEKLDNKIEVHQNTYTLYKSLRTDTFNIDLEEKIFYHSKQSSDWEIIKEIVLLYGRDFVRKGHFDKLLLIIQTLRNQNIHEGLFDILEGDIADARSDWNKALAHYTDASANENLLIKYEALLSCGVILKKKADIQKAENIYQKVISDIKNTPALQELYSQALVFLAHIKIEEGELTEALKLLDKSIEIQYTINSIIYLSHTFASKGDLLRTIGQNIEALELFDRSYNYAKELDDKRAIADILNRIGNLKGELGDKRQAIVVINQSLTLRQTIGDKIGIAACLSALGNIKTDSNKFQEALDLFEQAKKIAEEIQYTPSIVTALYNICLIKIHKNNLNDADILSQEALLYVNVDSPNTELALVLQLQGLIKLRSDRMKAIELLLSALKIWEKLGILSSMAACLNHIGASYRHIGKTEKSLAYLLKSMAICCKLGVPDATRNLDHFRKFKQQNKATYKAVFSVVYHQLDEALKKYILLPTLLGDPFINENKIGRNEICFCGSGKKFKMCHGRV